MSGTMITKRWLAVAMVAVSLGGTTAEAVPKAKPKPWVQTYEVFLPKPWVAESMGATDCAAAPQGLSKDIRTVSLAAAGKLSANLSDYLGEWTIEVYDAKGKLLTSASGAGGSQTVTLKHKTKKQAYKVAVCNYAGGPHGTVRLAYTPG